MKIGRADVDFDGLVITTEFGTHTVEPIVMDVLRHLADNPGQVISRSDLIDAVWGVSFGGDERLSRAISLLRKALGDSRGKHHTIQTISRRGYKLVADVTVGEGAENIAAPTVVSEETIPQEIDVPQTINTAQIKAVLDGTPPELVPVFKRPSIWLSALACFGLISAMVWFKPMSLMAPNPDAPAAVNNSMSMSQGLQQITNFTNEGAIANAKTAFSALLASSPDNAAANAGLSMALIREYTHAERDPALLKQAKAAAQAAMRADDKLALSHIASAWVHEFEGDFDGAHTALDRADILDPDNAFALESRIRAFHKQGRRGEAVAMTDYAMGVHPNTPIFYSYAGQFLLGQDKFAQAEAMFRRIVELTPNNSRAYAQLAQTLHLQDRTTEAVQVLQDGLLINPSDSLYNNLGTYLFFQGHYGIAADAFERALSFKGNSHAYLYWANYADAARFVPSRKDMANAAYDRALQLLQVEWDKMPDNESYYISKAALYNAKRGNLDAARDILSRLPITEDTPSSQLYRAAVTYEILTNRKEALDMLKLALEAGYPLTEVLNDPELSDLRQDMNYHYVLTARRP